MESGLAGEVEKIELAVPDHACRGVREALVDRFAQLASLANSGLENQARISEIVDSTLSALAVCAGQCERGLCILTVPHRDIKKEAKTEPRGSVVYCRGSSARTRPS